MKYGDELVPAHETEDSQDTKHLDIRQENLRIMLKEDCSDIGKGRNQHFLGIRSMDFVKIESQLMWLRISIK